MSWLARSGLRLLLMAWLLAALACSPPPAPPTPARLRIVAAPSARPLVERLTAEYGKRHPGVSLELSEAGPEAALEAVSSRQADLALLEREPTEAEMRSPEDAHLQFRAWPVAGDGVAVVVHAANPVRGLTTAQLQGVFEGAVRRWEDVGGNDAPVRLVSREPDAPARIAFEQGILQGHPLAGTAVVMPGDAAVAGYVAAHPDAIGYLSMAWVQGGIRAIAVDGTLPSPAAVADGSYRLSHPLVFVTRTGVGGEARRLIDYAHSREGRHTIAQLYAPLPR